MFISFIIPVFNTGDYLERCVESLINQSFREFEVIIIDDGSTDKSLEIAQRFASNDPRIHVYQQKNSGQGAARNRGVDLAKGEYIWFIDSDDWMMEEALVRVASILKNKTPDVLVANFAFTWEDGKVQPAPPPLAQISNQIVDPKTDADVFASLSCWNTPPWRLISQRSLLNEKQIRFASGLFYEDHPFAIQLMLAANRVYVDPTLSYAYFQRSGSTMSVSDKKAFDFISIRRQCITLLHDANHNGLFDPIIVSYISPLEFYRAHVNAEFQSDFINQLHEDTDTSEISLAREVGSPAYADFIDAIADNNMNKLDPKSKSAKIFSAIKTRGLSYIYKRLRESFKHRLKNIVRNLLQRVKNVTNEDHPGADFGGKRYLKVNNGCVVDQIFIDVRVNPEQRSYVVAGDNCIVSGTYVFERGLGEITIGNNSSIGGGSLLICSQDDGIKIGSNVMLSWNVTVIDTNAHSLDADIRKMDAYAWKLGIDTGRIGAYKDWGNVVSEPIVIEDQAWVGFGSSILKGVTIGKGSIVAAGSIVTKDVAPNTIVGGNPAQFIGYAPRENWTWEEIILSMQGDPNHKEMLKYAFLNGKPIESYELYTSGAEFSETKKLTDTIERKSARLLDVGSGIAITSAAFALEGFKVDSVEPETSHLTGRKGAEELISKLNEKLNLELQITLHTGYLDELDLTPGYDLAICRQVTHHFANPVESLSQIRDLLRPGGKAILIREHVIYDEEDKNRFLNEHPMQSFYQGENAYQKEEYVCFAEEAGFEVERVIHFTESPINYWPSSAETIENIGENVAGRPYTFLLKKPELNETVSSDEIQKVESCTES